MRSKSKDPVRRLILCLSSNFGLGYSPFASGTAGTLAGIPAFWLMAQLPAGAQLPLLALVIAASCWLSHRAGRYYGVVDDGRIVVDELAGYLVTVALLPFSWKAALLGFFWFRLFDITKPPPASHFDRRIKNGIGVTMDDVAAGVYAALALRLCLYFIN